MGEDLLAEVRAELTAPGGLFEITTEEVRGRPMPVFANRRRSLRQIVEGAVAHGDNEHLVLGDQRITFVDFIDEVAATAAALRDLHGVEAGDRIAIFSANRPEWVITYWATVSLGAIAVALNGWWTTDEVGYGLDLTDPSLLFGDTKRLARLDRVPDGLTLVDFEADFEPYRTHPHDGLPDQPIAEDDPATILFTSGTTGRPKGAIASHRGLVGFAEGMVYNGAEGAFVAARTGEAELGAERPQLVTLATSPLFHVSGLFAGIILGLAVGTKLVFREGRFDPADVLRIIEQERITQWSAMGSMGPRLLDCPDLATRDTSSVTNVGFGGAPVSADVQQRLRAAFPNSAGRSGMGYGSSESVAVITSIGGQDYLDRPDSCGRVNRTFEIEIRDANGEAVPAGVEGVIHVRSPYSMIGYWGNDEATADTIDADGWLDMGDIGRLDDDGWLTINSRARDMILRAAENIYPVEIEQRLEAHPDVAEAAVFGVDHPELGQEVKAVIVPVDGSTVDTDAVTAFAAETLAPFKVPSVWEIRPEPLPRNAAMKVMKGVLTGEHALGQIEE